MTMTTTQRIFVSGKVQGVGYRDHMCRKARDHGVVGWVRNTRDGRVEMLASGDDAAVQAFVEAAHTGPSFARVDHVEAHPDSEAPAKGFTKRFTA